MQESIVMQLLEQKGKTAGMIAQQLNVKPRTVYDTIHALPKKGSQRVRVQIALVVGKTPSFLWCDILPAKKLASDDAVYIESLKNINK